MFHNNCYGSEIQKSFLIADLKLKKGYYRDLSLIRLDCSGCGNTVWILDRDDTKEIIMKTSIDGQKRKILVYVGQLLSTPISYYDRKLSCIDKGLGCLFVDVYQQSSI